LWKEIEHPALCDFALNGHNNKFSFIKDAERKEQQEVGAY